MNKAILGVWMRRFLLEHLITERNLSRNTQRSYRDAFCLLVTFACNHAKKKNDQLLVEDVTGDCVRAFLNDLETRRGCSVRTRNQRLSAVHAFASFVGDRNPELISWDIGDITSKQVRSFLDGSGGPVTSVWFCKHQLAFREGVVVGYMRATVRFGDTQVGQQVGY